MSFFVNPALNFFERERGFREGGRRFDMNPVKHFAVLARGVMLKGVGLDVLLSELHSRCCCFRCCWWASARGVLGSS